VGLRVDWLLSGGTLYRTERATRCDTACDVPRGCPHVLWHLGKPMVCVQSSGHGMVGLFFGRVTCKLMESRLQYLVRSPGEHRWIMRKGDAEGYLA
jgi:hypothetical protein